MEKDPDQLKNLVDDPGYENALNRMRLLLRTAINSPRGKRVH